MLLAVDPGYAKCGYAVIEPKTARIATLGVIVTEQDKRADKSTDRARRIVVVTRRLIDLAHARACSHLAAEQMLGHGAAAAVAANMLPWGALIGIAVSLGIELCEVAAKAWQHGALGVSAKVKIDYAVLEQQLERLARTQVEPDLLRVEPKNRTHALDALGVGLFAAMTNGATRIAERRV